MSYEFEQLKKHRIIVGLCASCEHWDPYQGDMELSHKLTPESEGYCKDGRLDYPKAINSCLGWEDSNAKGS